MVNERDLKKLLEKHPEVSSLCQLVGQRYILNGFSDEETIILSSYLYEVLDVKKYKVYRAKDTLKIYEFLGGSFRNYQNALSSAEQNDYVNLILTDEKEKYPVLSAKKGIQKVFDIIKRTTGRELRIFKAGKVYAAKIQFEQFLEEEVLPTNQLFIVDSYVSGDLFKFLYTTFSKVKKLRILTDTVFNSKRFLEDLVAFEKEGKIEIEVKTTKNIHDRFIISDNRAWSIGTSIKDIGKKDSVISDQFSIRDTLLELLNERWNNSQVIYLHSENFRE